MSEEGSHDPLTCPIVPGQETSILIEKGRTGLGLSIVGGADTLLVSCSILSLILCGNEKNGSLERYFTWVKIFRIIPEFTVLRLYADFNSFLI